MKHTMSWTRASQLMRTMNTSYHQVSKQDLLGLALMNAFVGKKLLEAIESRQDLVLDFDFEEAEIEFTVPESATPEGPKN